MAWTLGAAADLLRERERERGREIARKKEKERERDGVGEASGDVYEALGQLGQDEPALG